MTYIKVILTVIAAMLALINFNLWGLERLPRRSDLIAIAEIKDETVRAEAAKKFKLSVPLVWVDGGDIDAEVRGTVECEK